MHLYGDSNLHTKRKENSSNVAQIYLTFQLWTKGTKIINLSPSVLVKLALTDKNKNCKKNTRVAWKIDWYKLIFHFYVVFFFLLWKLVRYIGTNKVGKKISIFYTRE